MKSVQGVGNVYATPAGYAAMPPLSGTTAAMGNLLPLYGTAMAPAGPVKAGVGKSESGLTYALPGSRKRSRDSFNPLDSALPGDVHNQTTANNAAFTFLGVDLSFHFLQQQLETDRFIVQETERLRMEIEEKRKKFCRRIAICIQENVAKKLKAKDEQINEIGKLNFALEERVKSLCVENQILKDIAQTNEATANALRCNLEQVLLTQVQDDRRNQQQVHHPPHDDEVDDAESCCGSNAEVGSNLRTLAETHDCDSKINAGNECCNRRNTTCRSCGKAESCVLLLPCRHLCLCTVCGSALHNCPVCTTAKTGSLHVNFFTS
ncbi:probable BOI-related E3 ubiquitin-protein ligase 3 [Andrographis paniculata]|uniref:probable BOI-related E3 ubiquitin-protein ligase 3 n=1 Tax=Andrographis paniculata TaxID=175694 RepID=UPI0021E956BC|nr:probable BOI-related E3 ubiquitin-protein ligase 3 [Andrographis paniculata]